MSTARFPVRIGAMRKQATVTIDRSTGLVTVRLYRERKAYELHLGELAEMVLWRVTELERREQKKARGAA